MINYLMLDKRVIKFLKEYGWYKGRRIEISNWIKQLTEEGYDIFEYALDILEEFWAIDVKPKRIKIGVKFPGDFDFQAFNAGSGEIEIKNFYESFAKENLYPLGMVYGQWFLYVGLSKKIYMGGGEEFYLLSINIEEFLNGIILGTLEPMKLNN